jgi:hypothetical protein
LKTMLVVIGMWAEADGGGRSSVAVIVATAATKAMPMRQDAAPGDPATRPIG